MKRSYLILLLVLACSGRLFAQNVSVDATIGTTSASYLTLKTAFDAINNGTHQGIIDIRVHNNTTETASALLDSNGAAGGASYTSVRISPADTATVPKVISTSVAGIVLVDLAGADNVTIDGRAMGAGSSLLTFQHLATTNTLSITMRLINGASNNVFTYTSFVSSATALANAINISLSTSAATTGNQNNSFLYCSITGGRTNLGIIGTVANPMDNIVVRGCTIANHGNAAISATSVLNLVIDSNTIFQTAGQAAASIGINIAPNISGAVHTVTRNRIRDLITTAATGMVGIQYAASVTTPLVAPVLNCFNNYISMAQSSGPVTSVVGFVFAGTTPAVCNFMHNSVLIAGTHTATTSNPGSVGINKSNSSTASVWRCRSNVSKNIRTGTAVFHVAAWVSGTVASQAALYDVDYNVYWSTSSGVTLYTIAAGTFFYATGGQAGYRADAGAQEQHTVFADLNFVSNTNLTLTGASVGDFATLSAPRNASVLRDIFNTLRGTTTYRGAHEAAPFALQDGAVKEVYTLGKLPVPYAVPHIIRANIQNLGIDTIFRQKVYVTITGSNSHLDSTIIDTIPPLQNRYATFNAFTYTNLGNCVVTVSVPNDDLNTNNTKSFNQIITNGTYTYADPTRPSAGGVGFTTGSGDFVAKFPYNGVNAINQVGVNFNTGGKSYSIVIYDLLNDTPNTVLWTSPAYTSIVGVNTIPVNPVIAVNGTFFVGVRQLTANDNVAFSYQAEDPIRDKTFYFKGTGVPAWVDFATNNSAFRFMVEPRLQAADDIGISGVIQPCQVVPAGTSAFFPQFKVFNYGLNSQSSYTVGSSITGPATYTSTNNVSTAVLSNEEAIITAPVSFNPSVAGTYTMKVWTDMGSDLEHNNDTLVQTFIVQDINTAPASAGNLRTFNLNQNMAVEGSGSLNITGNMITIETWVKPNTANAMYLVSKEQDAAVPQYGMYINPAGKLVFVLNTNSGIDSLISDSVIPAAAFSHVAVSFDGNLMKTFLNGAVTGEKIKGGTINGNTKPVIIGSSAHSTLFMNGSLDEMKIWDTCRTEDQIRMGMHTRLANFSQAKLKAYYRFDEAAGTLVADASGNCNSGSLLNAPLVAVSQIPLGSPVRAMQSVNASGVVTFAGTGISMNIFTQAGSNDIYIHRFSGAPMGTSPLLTPGGVTTLYPNYWLAYRYGNGTMDSALVDFNTGGILTGATASDIKMFGRAPGESTGWALITSGTAVNTTTQNVTMNVAPSGFMRQWSLGANNNPLPVSMGRLAGSADGKDAALAWDVFSESNNKGFRIERSFNGSSFEEIDFVKGAGNSRQRNTYHYSDRDVFAKNKVAAVYYRISDVDMDGHSSSVTNTVRVGSVNKEIAGVSVAPNPFGSTFGVTLDLLNNGPVNMTLTDLQGKVMMSVNEFFVKGSIAYPFSGTDNLKAGVYLLKVEMNGEAQTLKLVKMD